MFVCSLLELMSLLFFIGLDASLPHTHASMFKSQRISDSESSPPEVDGWILTVANGRKFWDWAYHSAFRSQQLSAQSESALVAAKSEASEFLAKGPTIGASPKRKRDNSPS